MDLEKMKLWLKESKIDKEKREKIMIAFLLGVLLLIISFPTGQNKKKTANKAGEDIVNEIKVVNENENEEYIYNMENKLKQVIGRIQDVGKVEVMITLKSSRELVVNKDAPYQYQSMEEEDSAGGKRNSNSTSRDEETVFIMADGNTAPIILSEREPEVRGVLVVCEGGNDAKVVVKVKEAVGALFQIESHNIIVCDMQYQ